MNNPYKISSFILVVVLMFYAARASLQIIEQSGDTGAKMSIVEPQDGVALEMNKFSTSTDETANFGLPVGEAGQDISLTLGEPETPILLGTSDASTDVQDDNSDVIASDPELVEGERGNPVDEQRDPSPTAQDDNSGVIASEPAGESGNPVDYKSEEETKDYWVYIRTYDKPEVSLGQTGGRSKEGDIVQILDASVYTTPSETEKKEWLIVKVPGLTKSQIDLMMKPWIENTESPDEGRTDRGSMESKTETIKGNPPSVRDGGGEKREVIKAYRKYKLDIDDLKNQEGINISEGLWREEIDKSDITNRLKPKDKKDISRYYWQSVRYALLTKFSIKLASLIVPRVRAASTVVSTINKTGEDYNTLTLWEDAKDGDLVTAQTIQQADCYDDDGDLEDKVTIDGSTDNADYYMKITTPAGERHNGTTGTGFKLKWTTGYAEGMILILDNYTRIEGIEFNLSQTATFGRGIRIGSLASSSDIRIEKNLFVETAVSGFQYAIQIEVTTGTINIWNNIFYDWANYGVYASAYLGGGAPTNLYVYNNTVYNSGTGIFTRLTDGIAITAKNNICNGNTIDYSGGFANTSTHNISEDQTAPAYGVYYRGTAVTFNNEVGDDFHLGSTDTAAINTGIDLSAIFTTDIDGVTRTGTWDIGADEYISTAPTFQPRPPASGTGTGPAMY